MKKTVCVGLVLLFATKATFAQKTTENIQIKSKSMQVSGVASYRYRNIKSRNLENNTFEFAQSAGFFVSKNVLIGAMAGYSSFTTTVSDIKRSKNNIYSAGAFGRYFYTPLKKYSFFNEVSVVYTHGETPISIEPQPNVDGLGGDISVGFIYFLTKRLGLQASVAGITYSTASFNEFENSVAQGFVIGGELTNLKIGAVIKL